MKTYLIPEIFVMNMSNEDVLTASGDKYQIDGGGIQTTNDVVTKTCTWFRSR